VSDLLLLRLDGLQERHPGLTQAVVDSYVEAAAVCFSRHHQSPVTLSLQHGADQEFRVVHYPVPDDRMLRAHGNEIDATEAGAYGVALAAVEAVAGLVAVGRAERLNGANWYVAPHGTDIFLQSADERIIDGKQSQARPGSRRRDLSTRGCCLRFGGDGGVALALPCGCRARGCCR
jgi:hypothetical protein